MESQAMAYQKRANFLVAVSSILISLCSCNTYKNARNANPVEKNCGSYETTGYTRETDTTDIGTLHGEVRLCKTGRLIQGAHVYVLGWKDSVIADTYTDSNGKYSLSYTGFNKVHKIEVSATGASIIIQVHDIGEYHKNTELNMRLYEVEVFVNEVPLTKDDLKQIERNRNK